MTTRQHDHVPDDEWEDMGGELVRLEKEGDFIQGTLLIKQTVMVGNPQGGQNEIGQYVIDVEGEKKLLNGSANIDPKMAQVNLGAYIKITYEGTTRTQRGTNVRLYKVQVRKTTN